MNASLYGLLCGLLLVGQPLFARGDVPVSWSAATCPPGEWPVVVTARGVDDPLDVKTFKGTVTAPGTFSLPLTGLYQRTYTVSAVTDGRFVSKSQIVRGDGPLPTPRPTPAPRSISRSSPTPVQSSTQTQSPTQPPQPQRFAITKPKAGETVRGDFTATLEATALPFRIELLKADGTLALPPFIRRTADPLVLTGASGLPSGAYTLVLKASANQTPPAVSVTITLENKK
jgi:hypothetical protein